MSQSYNKSGSKTTSKGSTFQDNNTTESHSDKLTKSSSIHHVCHKFMTPVNFAHLYFIAAAFMCFIPQWLGYSIILDPYPDGLQNLSSDNQLILSLVLSIVIAVPLVIEHMLDFIINKFFYFTKVSESSKMVYSKFPTFILLLIIATDFFIIYNIKLDYLTPLAGLTTFRDISIIWCFLHNLNKIGGCVWTLPKVFTIGTIFVVLNWMCVWISMNQTCYQSDAMMIAWQVVTAIGLFMCFYVAGEWISYVCSSTLSGMSFPKLLMVVQVSVSVFFFLSYVMCSWFTVFFGNNIDPDWNTFGIFYLMMVTYVTTAAILLINMITNTIAKVGATEMSKQLLCVREMFMRYLSHELRTPLNVVTSGLNVLTKELLPKFHHNTNHRCFETIKEIQLSCDIATTILGDMLLYDKIESGMLNLDKETIVPWHFLKSSLVPFFLQVS